MTRCDNRMRERISWQPVWNKDYEKWTAGFIKNHKWRVDRINDTQDLVQEAWFTFNHVEHTYPRCICPNHFKNLFKRAMINKMHDRSCRLKRRRDTVEAPTSVDIYEVFSGRIGETTNSGYVAALLNEQPEEMKLVLKMLAEGKLDAKPRTVKGMQPRENLSMRVRKFLNKRGTFNAFAHDPVLELRQLFT